MCISSSERLWDISWEDIHVMRCAFDLDEELVNELRGNPIEEFLDVRERMLSWVIISPSSIAEFHLSIVNLMYIMCKAGVKGI